MLICDGTVWNFWFGIGIYLICDLWLISSWTKSNFVMILQKKFHDGMMEWIVVWTGFCWIWVVTFGYFGYFQIWIIRLWTRKCFIFMICRGDFWADDWVRFLWGLLWSEILFIISFLVSYLQNKNDDDGGGATVYRFIRYFYIYFWFMRLY